LQNKEEGGTPKQIVVDDHDKKEEEVPEQRKLIKKEWSLVKDIDAKDGLIGYEASSKGDIHNSKKKMHH
jgi:hypothetical protein